MAEYDITAQITACLTEYSEAVAAEIDRAADKCAKGLVKDLKEISPKREGKYARSWTRKTTKNYSGGNKSYIVHNQKNYQLTHLLERPHVGPHGSIVAAHPHIARAEKKWTEQFVSLCEEACEG